MTTDPKKSAGDKKPQLQLIPPALSTEMASMVRRTWDSPDEFRILGNMKKLMGARR